MRDWIYLFIKTKHSTRTLFPEGPEDPPLTSPPEQVTWKANR